MGGSFKTAEIRIVKFSPYGIAPLFLQGKFRPEIPTAGSPERGRPTMEGWENEPFFRFTRQYLENGMRYIQSYC